MAQAQKKRPFLWIIVILLFVGLLGFGTGGLNGTIRSIGTAGDKDISIVAYRTQLNNQIRAFSNQIGSPLNFQQAQSMGLDQAVLQQVITQRTLDNEAAALGLSVGDAQVAERVQAIPNFRALDGTFDREAYAEALRRVGETEAAYEESIRDEVSRGLLQAAVASGLPAPEAYTNALLQYVGETRDITMARLTADDLTVPVPGPTDADIATYYAENGDQFMRPERRDITYVWLTPSMIQDQLEIDEDALRALYDERISQFVQPERRLVERLAFIDAPTAQAAADRLTAGETDFDALVAERGLDLSDVDMGDVAQDDLDGAGEAVFAATPGDVIGPLPSTLGPALFRINAVLAAEETPFDDARDELREELATQRAIRVIDQASETINDLIAGGATMADLAERTDLELGTIAFDADTSDGIAAYDSFREAAATAQIGDFATLLPLSDGGVFALQLDSITPPEQRPLEEVRDQAIAGWTAATTQSILLRFAEGKASELAPLTDFATAGLVPEEHDGLLRNSFVEGTPPGFVAQIFEMEVTEIRVIDAGDAALIVRLDRNTPPDPEDPQTQAQSEQIGNAALAGIAQDVFDAFAASVQARTEVTLNQAAINAVHTQMQ